MDNSQIGKSEEVVGMNSTPTRILPAWIAYGVFSFVLFVLLVVLFIPLPFTAALYHFETVSFEFALGPVLFFSALTIIIGNIVFSLLRNRLRTADSPRNNTPSLVVRLLIGPLFLWALIYLYERALVGFSFLVPALGAAASLSSVPIAFFFHGFISFYFAQTRKRFMVMFLASLFTVAAMPLVSSVMTPIAVAVNAAQYFMQDQQAANAKSMQDCAKIGGGHGWTKCISTFTKSKTDYFECLKQAPSKDRSSSPDDKGLSAELCDREYKSYIKRYTGHATEPGSDGVTYVVVPAEGTIAISECQDLTRYQAWSTCVNVAMVSTADYSVCKQQAQGRTETFGRWPASADCDTALAALKSDSALCNSIEVMGARGLCWNSVMETIDDSYDPYFCLHFQPFNYQLSCLAKIKSISPTDLNSICEEMRITFWITNGFGEASTTNWSSTCKKSWPIDKPDGVDCATQADGHSLKCTRSTS